MLGRDPPKGSKTERFKKLVHYRPKSRNEKSSSAALETQNVDNKPVNSNSTEPKKTVVEDISQPVVDKNSSESRGLWNKAFQSLPKQTQAQLKNIISGNGSVFCQADLEALREEVQRKQDQCETNAWKIQIQDHNIIIRDYGAKIASWLQKVGDVVIPFAPAEASPPWGVVKGLLQVVISHSDQMLILLGTVEKVVQVIWHGRVYESVFFSAPDVIHADASENLRNTLVKVYKAALELLAYSKDQLSKRVSKQIIEALVNPNGASGLLGDLQDQQSELDRVVSTCEISRSAGADAGLMQELQAINAPLARIDTRIESYFSKMDGERSLTILEKVSSILHNKYHVAIQRARTPETCEWILQTEEFCSWEKSSSPAILWLWGSPGTGKTFLTSKVIDRLKTTLEQSVNHEGLAFFYCNRNEEIRRQPISVLQSFLRQLASTLRNPDYIQTDLIEADTANRRNGLEFDETRCRELLLKSFNLYPRTTLVLDALDECDPGSRQTLLDFFNDIAHRASKPVKIFISSRPDEDIRRHFRAGPNIGIQANKTHDDIKKYIRERLAELSNSRKVIQRSQEHITTALLAKCDGMFQWTYLQLEQLKDCYSPEAIDNRLNSLPATLKEAYDELYEKIKKLDENDRRLADRAFQWVMAAVIPLTSNELLCAIQIDPTRDKLELSGPITEDDLLSLCQHFLVIDSERGIWKVSHLSVTEYFEQHHWTLQEAHLHVGNACLLVLLHPPEIDEEDSNPSPIIVTSQQAPFNAEGYFQFYLRTLWPVHVRAQEGHDQDTFSSMTRLLKTFIGSPTNSSIWFRSWLHELKTSGSNDMWQRIYGFIKNNIQDLFFPVECPMFVICRLGMYAALGDWWDNITDCVDQANLDEQGLVLLAVEGNSYSICETLLRAGFQIDINDTHGAPGNSLQAATRNGNLDIVKLLIEYHQSDVVNIPIPYKYHGSVLAIAAVRGHLHVVEYLLSEAGADVNLPLEGRHGSALTHAIRPGNLAMVKYLVECGAHLNIAEYGFGSALAAASWYGYFDIVQYLVQAGADANLHLTNGTYGSALAAAAAHNHFNIVQYLVQAGADANLHLTNGAYGSALAAAAAHNHFNIVQYLIQAGADAKQPLQAGIYGSVLAAATRLGYAKKPEYSLPILRYLIDKVGVEVVMELPGNFGSALIAAAFHGNREAVEVLVNSGANINTVARTGDYGTPLIAAACGHYPVETVKDLVEKHRAEVNVSVQTGVYGIALAASLSCARYDLDFVKISKYLVFETGAEVNVAFQVGAYGSPLIIAICSNRSELTKLLLSEAGADVNMPIQAGDYGSALIAAILENKEDESFDMVDYLVSNCGADVNLKATVGDYGSALAAAASLGRERHTKLLVHAGADANMVLDRGLYGSALAAATTSDPDCSGTVISTLIRECEADVDLLLPRGLGSALATAAALGHADDARLLIRAYNADPNLVLMKNTYGSALCAAAYFGRKDSVDVLLAEGALVSLKVDDHRFSNALGAATAQISQEELDQFKGHLKSEPAIKQTKEEISKLFHSMMEDTDRSTI